MSAEPNEESGRGFDPRFWWREHLPLETETAAFILVNVLDVGLTLAILYSGGREANPVARYFLDGWGPRGLVYYKLGMVAFVCVIAQVIARINKTAARRLLHVVTAIVFAVVIYSVLLLLRTPPR